MAIAVFVVLVLVTAMSGAVFKPGTWYEALKKPAWTPPNWAFPVVWTLLYIMILFAGWAVWTKAGWSLALAIWAAQLVLNGAWSWLFFGLRRMDLALVDVGLLWLAIAGFILAAWPLSTLSSLLFVPYLMWVSTAFLLNLSVLRLNAADRA
ncbi:TspO/MBR family protein [Roseibium aggregatum]|uniref:Tryptophan-rich sensory protein n=1 Tax=Roseibium aggregatum TaxID=187304 RepID=A0A939EHL5_9HYPH|nr:TspO/MBR family protein [Roseibium aggregatum]MBN9672861.1 tryptophan-rich sensory protein [Roseibium aggregatum]